MSRIITVDLTNEKITERYLEKSFENLGKSLALELIRDDNTTDKYSSKLVLAPGLLSGTLAPCTGRLSIVSKRLDNNRIKSGNLSGSISQKLASLDIGAIEVIGYSMDTVVLHINEDCISINKLNDFKYKKVEETIDSLRIKWGENTSIIGIGPAGEHALGIASLFSTYPNGIPKFHGSRGTMGDIFGVKGLKAVAVTTDKITKSPVKDRSIFIDNSKTISKSIINDPICGNALPTHGSITLIKLMNEGMKFHMDEETIKAGKIKGYHLYEGESSQKINKNCAAGCVIGCLNRHRKDGDKAYDAPSETEAINACKNLFGIVDNAYVSNLNKKCFDLGVETIEFLSSCALFLKAERIEYSKENINYMLEQIEKLTPIGRILSSTSKGISSLYRDEKALDIMVAKPSNTRGNEFNIKIPYRVSECEYLSDHEYLYSIMSSFDNLGICMFAIFPFLENKETIDCLVNLINEKTGENLTSKDLIKRSIGILEKHREWEEKDQCINISSYIPEFVKVLYKYYEV